MFLVASHVSENTLHHKKLWMAVKLVAFCETLLTFVLPLRKGSEPTYVYLNKIMHDNDSRKYLKPPGKNSVDQHRLQSNIFIIIRIFTLNLIY
jgi:hypothetical protein